MNRDNQRFLDSNEGELYSMVDEELFGHGVYVYSGDIYNLTVDPEDDYQSEILDDVEFVQKFDGDNITIIYYVDFWVHVGKDVSGCLDENESSVLEKQTVSFNRRYEGFVSVEARKTITQKDIKENPNKAINEGPFNIRVYDTNIDEICAES